MARLHEMKRTEMDSKGSKTNQTKPRFHNELKVHFNLKTPFHNAVFKSI